MSDDPSTPLDASVQGGGSDLNKYRDSGSYAIVGAGSVNTPTNDDGFLEVFTTGVNQVLQRYTASTVIAIRNLANGTWSPWRSTQLT